MRAVKMVVVFVVAMFLTGCKSYEYRKVQSGLFGNDAKRLMAAYESLKPGVATRADVAKLGFFSALNVKHVPGNEALQQLLGQNYFQSGILRGGKVDEDLLKSLNDYEMLVVPYKDLVEEKSYFYFSTRDEKLTGKELNIYFVFKGDSLIYSARNYREVEEKRKNKAFMQGVFPWLKILDTVKDVTN